MKQLNVALNISALEGAGEAPGGFQRMYNEAEFRMVMFGKDYPIVMFIENEGVGFFVQRGCCCSAPVGTRAVMSNSGGVAYTLDPLVLSLIPLGYGQSLHNMVRVKNDEEFVNRGKEAEIKKASKKIRGFWSGRLDLNQRLLDPQSSALPDCATPRMIVADVRRF